MPALIENTNLFLIRGDDETIQGRLNINNFQFYEYIYNILAILLLYAQIITLITQRLRNFYLS